MPVLYPTFITYAAELGDTVLRTLQKMLSLAQKTPVAGTGLVSAARTVTTNTGDIQTSGARGVIVYLDVTANPGLGGLRVGLVIKDPISGKTRTLVQTATLVTSNAFYVVEFVEGTGTLNGTTIPTGQCAISGVALGSVIQLSVIHTTADSYTYSLNYELLP